MHRHSLAAGNEAHDVIPGNRSTTLGELHPDVVRTQSSDRNRRIAARLRARLLRARRHSLGKRLLRTVSPTQVVDEAGHNVLRGNMSFPDSRVQSGYVRISERRRYRQNRVVIHQALKRQVLLAHRASQRFLARLDSFLAALLREPRLDLGTRTRGCNESKPIARRTRLVRLRCHDLDCLTRLQACIERDKTPVHLRAHSPVPDLRVHGIGKINGGRARGQDDDLSLRRKDVHLIAGDLITQRIEELLGVTRLAFHLDQSTQPVRLLVRAHPIGIATGSIRVLLVLPVRRYAMLGALVHVERADLDLHRLATRTDHRRMQGLVQIELRHCDVVFKATRDRIPAPMQRPQDSIAVLDRLHEDPDRNQVKDLVERLPTHDHLLVDRVVALRATTHRPLRTRAPQILLNLVDDVAQVLLTLRSALGDKAVDLLVNLRIQCLKGQLLKLPLHHVHAEPVSERRVNFEGLLGLLRRRLRRYEAPRPGVVQAVRQLDEEDTDVATHRDKHLAQGLGLCSSPVVHLVELGDTVHEVGNGFSVLGSQLFEGVVRILDCVMQQRGDERRRRHTHLCEDGRDSNRMGDIRLARLAHLSAMMFLSGAVRTLNDADIRLRVISAQRTHKRLNLRDRGAPSRAKPHEAGAHPGTSRRKRGACCHVVAAHGPMIATNERVRGSDDPRTRSLSRSSAHRCSAVSTVTSESTERPPSASSSSRTATASTEAPH